MALNETSTSANNHAVIVSSSRYWFNYRHAVNALVFYQLAKSNGIPDENIVLMLADDLPSDARNPHKNGMYHAGVTTASSLYDASTEVDYRGEDVTVETLVKVLLGRHSNSNAQHSQQHQPPVLHTNEDSNLLIYLTGHGGDQFFKFQDIEEITADEIASTLSEMHQRRKYKQVLVVADTCQAFTLGDAITAPNVMVIGSSLRGESSYAHHSDYQLGLSVIERYTHAFLQFINKANNNKKKDPKNKQKQVGNGDDGRTSFASMSVKEAMVDPYPFHQQRAHVGFREDLMERDIDTILMSEFFLNNQLSKVNAGGYDDKDNYMRLVSSPPSNDNRDSVPDITIQGWPKFVDITTASERIRISSSSRNLGARRTSSLPLSSGDSFFPMVSDPSDGRFLGLVALFVGLVLVVSKRT